MDLNVFGFMERFNREYTANFIDSESRYRYDRQPEMMRWNLRKLAEVRSLERGLTVVVAFGCVVQALLLPKSCVQGHECANPLLHRCDGRP